MKVKEGEDGRRWKEAGELSVTGHCGTRAPDCNFPFNDHALVFVCAHFTLKSGTCVKMRVLFTITCLCSLCNQILVYIRLLFEIRCLCFCVVLESHILV